MNGHEYRFPRDWKITSVIACSMLIVSAQASLANPNDRQSFREFKALNLDIERHAARQMYRAEHRQQRNPEARLRIQPMVNLTRTFSVPETTIQTQLNTRRENALNLKLAKDLTKNRTTQVDDSGQTVRTSSGFDLDLSSSQRNISLGKNLFADGGTVEITVGRENKTFGAGSMVSAAEYVAVKQALAGEQTVTIDGHGRAVGGNVDLESIASDRATLRASELVIPVNVTTSGDFARNSDFKLLGDLNNYGTLQVLSSDGSPRSGAIRAVDINNYKGATITSDISNLTLDASGDITNYGSIEGSGAIALSAAGFVNNHGTTRATDNVSLNGSRIRNSGVIESTAGNINLGGSASTAALVVVNTYGTLQALNGAINLRDSSYYGTSDSHIVGGDLFSKEVNIFAGQANANLNVGELTGLVNQTGLATHITAATEMLNIGSMCLTGDPTIYNTTGGINIDADVLVGENLVYVATGDITSADGITIQAGNPTRGFEINMIAGASFKLDGGGGVGSGAGAGAALMAEDCGCLGTEGLGTGGVILDVKASKTGGAILLGNDVTVSSRPTVLGGDQNGDGILMIAFKGKGTTTGSVNLAGTTVLTGGNGAGTNGDFYVLAENSKGTAITTGKVDATGGTGTDFGKSGTVGMFTVNLISSQKGQNVVYDANGNRTSTAFITGEVLNKTGDIIVTDTEAPVDILADGRLIINAGSLITLNGQAETVRGSAELISNVDIVDGPNALYKSALNIFLIANNIGTADNPITVDSPEVQSFGLNGKPAASNFVQVVGTGVLSITGNSSGSLLFDAPTRDVIVPSFGFLTGKDITINANSTGTLNNVIGSASVSVNLDTGSFVPSTFSKLSTKSLTLTSNSGNIGSSITAFTLPGGATTIAAKTNSGDINLRNATGDALTFTQLEATLGDITLNAQNSITLAPSVTAGGKLDVTTTGGTIFASGPVTAADGISLVNTNTSGKISIAKDSTLTTNAETAGDGDIILSVGTTTDVPTPLPISNVEINTTGTGVVAIFGTGLTGSSPVNKLNVIETADIRVINGTRKASSINLGGNVVIQAQ